MTATSLPNALSIAGVDPSGGAGLYADLKTFAAFGVYGTGVVAALTAQNTRGVSAVHIPPTAFLQAQLATLFEDVAIAAIKTGMLANAEVIDTVAAALARLAPNIPLVVDPVMIATSGDALLAPDAVAVLSERLLPLAWVVTPNLPEAAALTGLPEPRNEAMMRAVASRLWGMLAQHRAEHPRWVVLKGGHLRGDTLVDLAFDGSQWHRFEARRRSTAPLHGTGCTFAAAITAALAHGLAVPVAIARAHTYLQGAIAHADRVTVGSGARVLHHGWQSDLPRS